MCEYLIRDLSFHNLEREIAIDDNIIDKLGECGIKCRKQDWAIEVLYTISDESYVDLCSMVNIYYTLKDVIENSLVYEPSLLPNSKYRQKEPENQVEYYHDGIHVEQMLMKALGFDQIVISHPKDEIMVAEDIIDNKNVLEGIPPVFLRSDFVSLSNRLNTLKLSMEKTLVTT